MKTTFNDYLISYLTLFSGLSISLVAIYYSVSGLTAIYPASVIPIIVMGVFLELGKLSATVWLKQNWSHAPMMLKAYILPAVAIIMLITSVGVFGYLSKAHSDQNLVSGDVQARLAVYDEKIRTEKENIDANRKSLKQMDEAVDQTMARSTTENGADRSVVIRRSQQKERGRLLEDISKSQQRITTLNEERAPIAAEVRKVEAEVGPIKYIAAFLYGDNPDGNLLERAVTWVTVLIVIVLDPLAIVLLLASQYSFQRIRESKDNTGKVVIDSTDTIVGIVPEEHTTIAELDQDVGEPPTAEDLEAIDNVTTSTVDYQFIDDIQEVDYLSPIEKEEYVQNEEQRSSAVWSNTVSNISQQEYIQASQERLENHIDEIVELIKSGHLSLEEVPKTVREQVRVKL